MRQNHYCVIMAGGVGSRFWPLSREERPKQFLDILGSGRSLIQQTYDRFETICGSENIFIVTNERYRDLIKEQLGTLPDENLLFEPARRNTAPCIGYACFKIKKLNPNAQIVVSPADHIIEDEAAFSAVMEKGLDYAERSDDLLTIGINPNRPDTGYGYIHFDEEISSGVYSVESFTEKPDLETAKDYIAKGEYLWNAGIFIWSVNSICREFTNHLPKISDFFSDLESDWNTEREKVKVTQGFSTLPDISIDYGVMEKAKKVSVIPAEFGWSDLGTWASLYEKSSLDRDNNSVLSGPSVIENSQNNIIRTTDNKEVIINGLNDFIVIETDKSLLICPKSEEQKIKKLLKSLNT